MKERGKLIVVEGIDGTGKTTLVAELERRLAGNGVAALRSFEPTKGKYGARIRALALHGREGVTPEEEAALFIADRREHVEGVIAPALAAGTAVLLDRYYFSTMAYQGARGLDPESIRKENETFAPSPDLLALLDLPVAEALERIVGKRGSTPDHFEGADYLTRAREIFLQIKHPNRLVLDARLSTEELASIILEKL